MKHRDQVTLARWLCKTARAPINAGGAAGNSWRGFQRLGRRERRQDTGQTLRQHPLAGTRRADHQPFKAPYSSQGRPHPRPWETISPRVILSGGLKLGAIYENRRKLPLWLYQVRGRS